MPKLGSWNVTYDTKLLRLLNKGAKAGGIDRLNLSKEYIEDIVIAKFFPDRQYKSFGRLYRGKVRQYQVNKTLNGGRKARHGKSDISKLYAPNSLLNYQPRSFNFF